MPMLTPPPVAQPRSTVASLPTKPIAAPNIPTPNPRVGDIGKLLLIGEPDSGYRSAFDLYPGGTIVVGRPSHGHKHTAPLAYFPSRAVSRTHALITMQDDGVYITHLKPSNLTWRAVNSIWTPMKVGEKAKLAHKDILCFGTAPKTKAYSNKVDAPFTISVAFVPKGEEVSWAKYKFVKRTIHRPTPQAVKPRPMDSSMQLLLSDMNGLNVSLDATLDDESNDTHPPTVKRKRSDIAEGQGSEDDTPHRIKDHGERKLAGKIAAEDTSKKRRLPESISRAYCDDVVALPESLTKMSLT